MGYSLPKLFDNIMVMNKAGQVIYDYITDHAYCSEFFGQMLGAFNALVEQLSDGQLSSMEWGEKNVFIEKKDELYFVACCVPTTKEKKANQELENAVKRFFDIYSTMLLQEFNGDRNIFKNSEARYTEALKYMSLIE